MDIDALKTGKREMNASVPCHSQYTGLFQVVEVKDA
jgi:hypothetical protein